MPLLALPLLLPLMPPATPLMLPLIAVSAGYADADTPLPLAAASYAAAATLILLVSMLFRHDVYDDATPAAARCCRHDKLMLILFRYSAMPLPRCRLALLFRDAAQCFHCRADADFRRFRQYRLSIS